MIVSLDELYALLIDNKLAGNKFVSFTFDDGYKDTFTIAYPVMKKYNIPFTICLTTGVPDRTAVLWWLLLEDLLLKHDEINFELNNKIHYFKTGTPTEKYTAFRNVRSIILDTHDDYLDKLHKIFDPYKLDLYRPAEDFGVNWEQIKVMSRDQNVTIASHGVNHLPLNKISINSVRKEIAGSIERINEQTGRKVDHFCYPYGRTENGPREFEIVKSCGLKTAITTRFANVFHEHRDYLCCLPRIYKIGTMPLIKYLDVLASGALSALRYKFKRVVTD
jgi:peptidoglycan/xylan/chitin deacetylase (PgdA/CDA1 family)